MTMSEEKLHFARVYLLLVRCNVQACMKMLLRVTCWIEHFSESYHCVALVTSCNFHVEYTSKFNDRNLHLNFDYYHRSSPNNYTYFCGTTWTISLNQLLKVILHEHYLLV